MADESSPYWYDDDNDGTMTQISRFAHFGSTRGLKIENQSHEMKMADVLMVKGGRPAVRDKAARTTEQAAEADTDSDDSLSALFMDNGPVLKRRRVTSLDCPGCSLMHGHTQTRSCTVTNVLQVSAPRVRC